MSQNISRDEAATTLNLSRGAITKMRNSGALAYTYNENNGYEYPKSFIEGLAIASNGIRVTRDFAQLYLIAWQLSYQLIPHRNAMTKIHELHQQNVILTDLEVARLVGYGNDTVSRWRTRGWIRSVKLGYWQLSLRQDINILKTLLDNATGSEMAETLGVHPNTIRNRFLAGQIPATRAPNGGLRADPAEISILAAKQTEITSGTLSSVAVSEILCVPVKTVRTWTDHGVLSAIIYGGQRHYQPDEITKVLKRFETITEGFEWLSATLTGSVKTGQLWTSQKSARYLTITRSQLHKWSKCGLVPFYLRTPEGLAAVERRYIAAYIISLKTFAKDNKVTKAMAQHYYTLCQSRKFII